MSSTPPPQPLSGPNDPALLPSLSKNFQASDADVIFKSSDNVLFHLHRKNIEAHSAAFPPCEINTNGEFVPLTEDASTLENLFQYVYPRRHLDIKLLPSDDLFKLAEAAEKYEMYCVMSICKARIE
ncbi:hypothetical protein H0H87_012660 [Tephrocybe sp. NHM501043]|nr:hypothetical protein H0H87_012660 [Tephrocybe sp. NHM501043]